LLLVLCKDLNVARTDDAPEGTKPRAIGQLPKNGR
jgi:hypothetical protein